MREHSVVRIIFLVGPVNDGVASLVFSPDGKLLFGADGQAVAVLWDAVTGKKVETQHYSTQGFHTVEGQMFPKAEKVISDKDAKTSVLEIKYSDIKIETAPAGASAR